MTEEEELPQRTPDEDPAAAIERLSGELDGVARVETGGAVEFRRGGIPFVVWLVLLLGALMVIRKKGTGDLASLWPVGSDLPPAVVTYIVAGGAIVLVATVAPEIVTQMLMVMVLLAFLVDVPYLTPTFDWVNAKVKTLAPA